MDVRVKHCPDCPWFDRGMNDPTCGKDIKVIPNSGQLGQLPPPRDCPLRKGSVTVTHYVDG